MTKFKLGTTLLLTSALTATAAIAAEPLAINGSAKVEVNAGSGHFAPYYIGANRQGTISSARGISMSANVHKDLDLGRRFSYGFGMEGYVSAANSVAYQRYDAEKKSWYDHDQRPSNAWLQQLYAEVKFRGVFLTVGMKEQHYPLLNERLSSGDLVHGFNARPMPGVCAGFIDFQNIPFTNGWLQIQGELGFWKYDDNNWQRNHYNYFNNHINIGSWHNYKRCFFRTKPSQPLSLTIGMQAAAQFSGTTTWYRDGAAMSSHEFGLRFKDFIDMIVLREGDDYWKGNHVGSWDINLRYRLTSGHQIKLYGQWLWEDGSGIGKLNGWDGLWGLEWQAPKRGPISGAVIEVLTFMNQSGSMHYDPADIPGTTMTGTQATGADNYYNNTWYNGYAYFGQSLGSPMFPSPIFNTDGFTTAFVDNRFWGIHGGVNGAVNKDIDYRLLASYRKFYGTMMIPRIHTVHDVSAMLEANWHPASVPGLTVTAQVAFDCGDSTYGNNAGALVSVSYSGLFSKFSSR
ncbi:MAG: capsule assembly Wzi family protein [Muribaculaceae bacterium]|nr:capsule assembly Wzi family protein [Muribaculaceae bacterium]